MPQEKVSWAQEAYLSRYSYTLSRSRLTQSQVEVHRKALKQIEENILLICEDNIVTPPKPFVPSVLAWPRSSMPITWRVNWDGALKQFTQRQMLAVIRKVFQEYESLGTILNFREIGSGTPDLQIGFNKVDGPGDTLAFVFQPASGLNMQACGGACGDYTFDNEETYSIQDFENIFRHETGHAVGAGHFQSGIMSASYRFGTPNIELDQLIIDYVKSGYAPILA